MLDEVRQEMLSAFGLRLAGKRKKAIDARRNSGIEEVWREDEEFREGVDDANRDTSNAYTLKNAYEKANGFGQQYTGGRRSGSTVFLNITAPYIANAVASLSDMLMPTDDQPFRIEPTPIPFLREDLDSQDEVVGSAG